MKEFKYSQTFATKHIRIIVPEDKSKQLALASLDSLKGILPSDINAEENPDLVFNCFNAACVNLINLNDDGITTDTAIAIYKQFNRKFIDLEHNRKNVVGTIISSGFSEKFTNRLLTEDEVRASNKPFNITLGGVVWHIINPKFADALVESADDSSPEYETISASWEIGFDEYHIALGSKDLTQAEIITDPEQVKEFESLLRVNQGFGKTKDGVPVYRVIAGEALPLGIGYTTTPAADVKGVTVANSIIEPDEEDVKTASKFGISKEDLVVAINTFKEEALKQTVSTQQNINEKQKSEKNNSHLENVAVNNNSIMKKFTKLEDITDETLQESNAAAVTNFIGKYVNDKIDEASTEFAEKLEAEKKAKEAEAAKTKEIQEKLDNTLKEFTDVKEELQKERDARAAQKAEADFNARMTDLDSKYELSDKDRGLIVADIKALDEKAYASWLERFETFAEAKKKTPKANNSQENDNKKKNDSKASTEEVLNAAKENENELPPNNVETEVSMKEEYANAFGLENFKKQK